MSEETHDSEAKRDKETAITRAWRQGGPFTPAQRKEAKELFLEALRRDPTVSFACEYAGIVRATAYRWKELDSKFATGWEDAVERTKDVARQSIYTRGIIGWDEKVVSNGQMVMEYEPVVDEDGNQRFDEKGKPLFKGGKPLLQKKYSDSLAALYAKANLPEYKDKQHVEHTGKDGGPIEISDVRERMIQKIVSIKQNMESSKENPL